jgi:hypothetical protein
MNYYSGKRFALSRSIPGNAVASSPRVSKKKNYVDRITVSGTGVTNNLIGADLSIGG